MLNSSVTTQPTSPASDETPDGYFLPELPRLLPVAYHPEAARIEFRSNGWVRHYLRECFDSEAELLKFLRERCGLYGPLVAPLADEQRALDLADFNQFVGLVDNLTVDRSGLGASLDEAHGVFEKVLAGFDSGAGAASPFERAAADLWRRIGPGMSQRQRERFSTGMTVLFRGVSAELSFQLNGRVPDYDTYIAIRLESFGCDGIVLNTEYAMAVDMSEFTAAPEFREMYAHSMRQMILINDVLSLRKEVGDPINAVTVLRHHEGLKLQGAVDRVCRLAEHHERGYIAARDAFLGGPDGRRADVRAFFHGMDHLLAGAQEFEYLTPRYFGDGSVWDGSTSGWLSLTGGATRLQS